MAVQLNCSDGTIKKRLIEAGISTRSMSEAVSLAQTGKRHTKKWNEAIGRGHRNMSDESRENQVTAIMKCARNYGNRSKGGTRKDLGIYVRSRWEANYGRYLNWMISRGEIRLWEYEKDRFDFPVKRGGRSYTPDFKVTENNGDIIYHEVKGWMDPKSKTRMKRMAHYHPEIRIILIGEKEYKALSKWRAMIPNWER
jgi:hypothetical protein